MADAKLMSDWEEMEGLANQAIDDSLLVVDDDNDETLKPINAASMSSADLYIEMEARKMVSTGFADSDRDKLQIALNHEFEDKLEEKKAERRNIKRRQIQQANLKKRRQLMEKTLQDEQDELVKNHQVAMMIDLVKDNLTADTVKIDVNSVSARSLAKAMWANNTITCLDLSNNNINDHGGSYVARILKRNNTLKKIELDNNQLGPKTCQAFGESLKINTSLRTLNLDSNPLTTDGADYSGVEQLADALVTNTTLTYCNMFRCNISSKGGMALAKALNRNGTILFFDVGHNGIDACDMKEIANKLDGNLATFNDLERQRREDEKVENSKEQKRQDIINEEKKQDELQRWLAQRRDERAENRRVNEVSVNLTYSCVGGGLYMFNISLVYYVCFVYRSNVLSKRGRRRSSSPNTSSRSERMKPRLWRRPRLRRKRRKTRKRSKFAFSSALLVDAIFRCFIFCIYKHPVSKF